MSTRTRAAVARGAACALLAALVTLPGCRSAAPPEDADAAQTTVAPLVERAERLRDKNDYDGAIAAYEQALAKTPWNDRIRHALAMTHAERARSFRDEGLLVKAETDLRRAQELEPEHPNVRQNLAVVLVERAALDMDPAKAAARRAEAETLAPGVTAAEPERDAGLERRLDLAYELVQRGQVEAGIARLESLRESHPDEPEVTRLLGAALVQHAATLVERGNHIGAGELLDRAVALYQTPECRAPAWQGCPAEDARVAHYNRVVAWLEAFEPARAEGAMRDAERAGLVFPELAAELSEQKKVKR